MLLTRAELLDIGDSSAGDLSESDRRALAEAVRRPVVTFGLFVETGGEQVEHEGWLSRRLVAFQASGPADEARGVRYGPASWLPTFVAETTGLGPRLPPSGAQGLVERAEIRRAFDDGVEVEGLGPVACVWTLRWRDPEPAGLTVVDQGPDGRLWTVRAVQDDRLLIDDVGTMAVWARLGSLLGQVRQPGSPGDAAEAEEAGDADEVGVSS